MRVEKNNQGHVKIYSRRDAEWEQRRFKKGEVVQAFTVYGTLMLDREHPLIYRVIDVNGCGQEYFTFLTQDCVPHFRPGDFYMIDNCSYHVSGPIFEAISSICETLEVHMYKLPTYSPELNPIEIVWAIVKGRLQKTLFEDDFLPTVIRLLSEVTMDDVLNAYRKCGYFGEQQTLHVQQ